jgi:uncharacterized repeat protein (TIGR03803 family)
MSRFLKKIAAAVSLATVVSWCADAQANGALHVLYSFAGVSGDGASPFAGLVQDAAGNFYGTTVTGGNASGAGTVFKLAPDGTETVLYDFTDGSDGGIPYANLVLDGQGNLYGTTFSGGQPECNCGVVFKVTPDGQESVLHTFVGGSDGATPLYGLIFDKHGNLYGTTSAGGGASCNCGTVFELAPDGTETIVHSFAGGSDGSDPEAGLLIDKGGNLYGASYEGGDATCNCGTIFKIDRSHSESVLYAFTGLTKGDGAYPQTSLVTDKLGNLYGTTKFGGTNNGGTVFKLAPDNTETIVHSFTGGGGDGAAPYVGLVADRRGNLYGTTQQGGGADAGTVFKITAEGQESLLYSFTGGTDGDQPFDALILAGKNELVGTAAGGGAQGFGTVFQMKARKQ